MARKSIKAEEQISARFIAGYFGVEPVYEPLGRGSPPDFCIERIAFEVRRLNQFHIQADGTYEPLEQVEYALRVRRRFR
jgi:hypothetical protein